MSQHSSRGPAWDALRLAVLERDNWQCAYCGKHLIGDEATVDHLLAKVQGGEDSMGNLVASCREDNGRKGGKALNRMNWFDPAWIDHL